MVQCRKKSPQRAEVRRRTMSMYPRELGPIPEETARVARAACPKGTLAMRLRDALGELYQDEQFVALYPVEGQPAYAPWRLAVVTVLQYTENLTDRQAANAVRERIDWKYSLGLELTDPGFDFSLLSEFRMRLVDSQKETLMLDRLLEVCKQRGWLKAGGKQRTDSTHVLARVRSLSNLECVGETLRAVLDDLAQLAPHWRSRSGRMACICCLLWSSPKHLLNSRMLPVYTCSGRSGSSITTCLVGRPNGEQARKRAQMKGSFVPPMTQKHEPAKSGRRRGLGTRFI